MARPSYECNFYLHNFKLILRLSHAQSQKGRRGRGGRKSEKKATANLSQKRINEIKLSLFRRNASHSHWMLACRGGPQSGGVVAEEAGGWRQEEGSCNAAAFCFLYVVSSCWFFFALLLFFPFNCNAYLRPLSLPLSLSLCSLGIVCRWNFWLSWKGSGGRGGVAAASRRPYQVTTRTNLLCALSGLGSCCCYCRCCLARTRISSSSACLCRQFSLLLLLLFSKCFVFCFFFTVILIF